MATFTISGKANLPGDLDVLAGSYTARLADPVNDPDGSWRGGSELVQTEPDGTCTMVLPAGIYEFTFISADRSVRRGPKLYNLQGNVTWATVFGSTVPVVIPPDVVMQSTIVDAKGDLIAGTANDQIARLPVGANGAALLADTTQTTGLRWSTARLLEGTGQPEGVVTGPVGSRYVDTAATAGAVEWVKTSGTGNTGWNVIYGDTGWRNITLINGWAAQEARLRRIGPTCWLRIMTSNGAASTSLTAFILPAGFRPIGSMALVGTEVQSPIADSGIAVPYVSGDNSVRMNQSLTTHLLESWPTDDPWPALLPWP